MYETGSTSLFGMGAASLALIAATAIWVLPATPPVSLDAAQKRAPSSQSQPAQLSDLSAITERPLFDRSRSKQVIETAAPAPAPAAPTLALHGIMGDNLSADGFTALLRLSNSTELFALSEKERVGEWTIEQIEADHVVTQDAEGKRQFIYLVGREP